MTGGRAAALTKRVRPGPSRLLPSPRARRCARPGTATGARPARTPQPPRVAAPPARPAGRCGAWSRPPQPEAAAGPAAPLRGGRGGRRPRGRSPVWPGAPGALRQRAAPCRCWPWWALGRGRQRPGSAEAAEGGIPLSLAAGSAAGAPGRGMPARLAAAPCCSADALRKALEPESRAQRDAVQHCSREGLWMSPGKAAPKTPRCCRSSCVRDARSAPGCCGRARICAEFASPVPDPGGGEGRF